AYLSLDGARTFTRKKGDTSPFAIGLDATGKDVWLGGSERPMFHSSDGGESFSPLATSPLEFVNGVHFWDASRGIVTSGSGDGGATWSPHEFGRDVLPGIPDFAVVGDSVFVVGGLAFPTMGDGTVFAASPDGGKTWSLSHLVDRAHDRKSGQLRGIAAVSAR